MLETGVVGRALLPAVGAGNWCGVMGILLLPGGRGGAGGCGRPIRVGHCDRLLRFGGLGSGIGARHWGSRY